MAAATALSLLLLEGLLFLLGFPRFDACEPLAEPPWQADAEAGVVLRPHAQIGIGRTNAIGLRGPELALARSPGVARVLTIGDSTCWGLGVPLERTFAWRGPELAAEAVGSAIEVVNGCVPGHSSFQSRAMLRRLLRFEPDVVVFYVGARNDADRHRYYPDADIPARLARREAGWHGVRVLQAAEAAWDLVYKKVLRKPLSHARRARVPPQDFAVNVDALLAEVARFGARSVVLLPPWSESLIARYPLIPVYQRILAERARANGAAVVALQPVFRAHLEEEVYHEDRLHFAAPGHELAARALAPALAASLSGGGWPP